ncbi:MAG: kynurenine formamidase [Candidatus Azotimanducaceae bacterium]|jgi:kynurenine formamidase
MRHVMITPSIAPSIIFIILLLLAPAMNALAEKPTNWGKWGTEDERGAANYIQPQHIVAAAKLIKTGKIFSLAIPLDNTGPVFPSRIAPQHIMVATGADYTAGQKAFYGTAKFADDYIYMPLQGSTQWDALSHAWYGDTLYNDIDQGVIKSAPAAGGATKLGIENVKTGFVGRAVLIDVLAYKGGSLPTGYAISRADIEATLKQQKTTVMEGDVVIIRTGVVPAYYELKDPISQLKFITGPQAGINIDVVGWVAEAKVAAIAADNIALEVTPNPEPEKTFSVHGALLKDLGVYIGEIWWLEELAADCSEDGRYEFFLAAQPLNITGAVGSPLNPIAIK